MIPVPPYHCQEILGVLEVCWQVQAGAAEEGASGSALREAAFVIEVRL